VLLKPPDLILEGFPVVKPNFNHHSLDFRTETNEHDPDHRFSVRHWSSLERITGQTLPWANVSGQRECDRADVNPESSHWQGILESEKADWADRSDGESTSSLLLDF
jgi:hypothetical protein